MTATDSTPRRGLDRRPRPTIALVAAAAQVSPRTVSRFLSDASAVTVRTRHRVESAMRDLGYQPAVAGTDVAAARISVIALHDAPAEIVRGILKGVGDAASLDGSEVSHTDVVVSSDGDVERALTAALQSRVSEGVAGVILIATHEAVISAARSAAATLPLVVTLTDHDEVASVAIDSYNGGVQATRHLLALGHTAIAHVAGPQSLPHARDRLRGFLDSLAEAGARPVEVVTGDWTAEAGFAAGRALLRSGATAVFCASDQIALGVMHAFADAGRAAPVGISVIGYDDEPSAAFFSPTLTTIRQDYSRVGAEAVVVLGELFAEGRRTHSNLVPELVVRSSTAVHR